MSKKIKKAINMAVQGKVKPSFDPQKNYQWQPTDTFYISGAQFASLYHSLQQQANNVGGAPVMLIAEAYNVVMDILKDGIADGTILEATASTPVVDQAAVKSMFK